ncbi:MAG: hypothetical protein IPQ07_16170 [Myxococcales bacterium]|nr:hypothetical protein [Myxococcales bacterium]
MTLTLALGSAHDQLVFSEPRAFLHAPIEPPRVRLDAEPLLKRHVSSYLLSLFFEEVVAKAGAGNPMKAFGTVEEFIFLPAGPGVSPSKAQELGLADQDPLWVGYERWLSTLEIGTPLAKKIEVLCRGTVLEGYSIEQISIESRAALHRAVEAAQREKEVLDLQRKQEEDKGDGKKDEQFLRALAYQESALFSETVIPFWRARVSCRDSASPLDVVKLNTRWRLNSRRDKKGAAEEPLPALRMERALDLALASTYPATRSSQGNGSFGLRASREIGTRPRRTPSAGATSLNA